MIARRPRKRVICFIDDDPNEFRRFAQAVQPRYEVIAATTFAACREQLDQRKLPQPDLWVLDLYFPSTEHAPNSPEELAAMNAKYLRLHLATLEFRAFLERIGQGVSGGLALIDRCRAAGGPVVMLTRKGTLEDAALCLDRGAAAVLRKPMPPRPPHEETSEAIRQALDAAMAEAAETLIARFERLLRANTHWARHRAAYLWWLGVVVGAVGAWAAGWLLPRLGGG